MIRTVLALLFAAFGTVGAFAAPGDWTRIGYPVVAQEMGAEPVNLTNAARAPPHTSVNLTSSGIAFAQTADLRVFDGAATTGAVHTLLRSSVAPNGGVNLVIDTKIQTQMTNRGWSRQDIDNVIADGPTGRTTDNRRPNKTDDGLGRNDTATVYGSSGNYVVVNDRTVKSSK